MMRKYTVISYINTLSYFNEDARVLSYANSKVLQHFTAHKGRHFPCLTTIFFTVYGLDNFWENLEASQEKDGVDGNDEKTLER